MQPSDVYGPDTLLDPNGPPIPMIPMSDVTHSWVRALLIGFPKTGKTRVLATC